MINSRFSRLSHMGKFYFSFFPHRKKISQLATFSADGTRARSKKGLPMAMDYSQQRNAFYHHFITDFQTTISGCVCLSFSQAFAFRPNGRHLWHLCRVYSLVGQFEGNT